MTTETTRGGTVSVVLVRPLVLALLGDEAALAALYRATDLTPEMIADTEARISAAQFCVAWAQAIELSKDPALALRIADTIPPGAFGVVEYVCRSAPTLGDAIESWVRYLGLLDDAVRVALVDGAEGERAIRVTEESEAPAPASHELCWAVIARRGAALVGPAFHVRAVRFTHRVRPALVARYEAFFGCEVRFGAAHTEMILAPALLRAPLPSSDPSLLAILERAAEAQRRERPKALPLTAQVQRLLSAATSTGASDRGEGAELDAIARKLGLGGRSLQRRLKDEGTSFQALRDETRRDLAGRYFDQGLSIAEVSFLLGFSEPSAFFRAFKRWTGLTPIAWRARA